MGSGDASHDHKVDADDEVDRRINRLTTIDPLGAHAASASREPSDTRDR